MQIFEVVYDQQGDYVVKTFSSKFYMLGTRFWVNSLKEERAELKLRRMVAKDPVLLILEFSFESTVHGIDPREWIGTEIREYGKLK